VYKHGSRFGKYSLKNKKTRSFKMDKGEFNRLKDRMKVQVNLSWEQEEEKLSYYGLKDGMQVLEVGSGPGFITEKLLTKYKKSHITALEINEDFIKHTESQLKTEADNNRLSLIQGDITDSNLQSESFDFVFVRLVLQHLENPEAAISEIYRVLKPGGKLVVIDVDDEIWGLVEPRVQELEHILGSHAEEQKHEGGNRYIGRDLHRLMKQGEFEKVKLDLIPVHSGDIGVDAFLPQIDVDEMRKMVENGFATEEEILAVKDACDKLIDREDSFVMLILFMAFAQKKQA